MKINFVIPSTVMGGGLRVAFTYANFLVESGHDVVVYVPCIFSWEDIDNGKINLKTSIANTFFRKLKIEWFDCHFSVRFALKIKDEYIRDADVTIATAWYTAKNVCHLSASKGKKVYFIQGYEINEVNTNKEMVDNSFKLPMHKIVIANWLDDIVFKLCGEHAKVIYNGTADNEFYSGDKILNHPRTIIMLGNQAEHKGWKPGLEVLKKAYKKYGCRIILYGALPIEDIPEYIEFYLRPKRDYLMQLYREADICLFPSIQEGWGLIVTEAMAHQCAIVGNNTGVVKEICVNGENALISETKTSEELFELLEQLLTDDKLLRHMQDSAFETSCKYKGSTQNKVFKDYLEELVAK